MKTAFSLSIVIVLVCALTACIQEEDPYFDPRVSLTGTVTITRNGIPLNYENFPINELAEDSYHRRIWLSAFISPDGGWAGNTISVFSNDTDLALGKYTWVMNFDPSRIPGLIFFEVDIPAVPSSIRKITEGIWIQNRNSIIDIGIVDFEVVRISGNLPVTFNGNPPSTTNTSSTLYSSPRIRISQPRSLQSAGSTIIQPNGDWMLDIFPESSQTPFTFTVDARENGGTFSRDLNPNHIITIHGASETIVFPDYPNLDFEAFSMAGTVNIPDSGGELSLAIDFYHPDFPPDSLIGRVNISRHQTNENGLFEWNLMVPVFSLPEELIFRLYITVDHIRVFRTYYGRLDLTNETDLSNINLGTFTVN